jgi:L,D-transpeptidase YcbB
MWSVRLDRFLAGTALTLILPVALLATASAQDARNPAAAEIEAAVPVPPTPELPPLTIKDFEAVQPTSPNAVLAERLRALSSGAFDRLIGSRKDRESIDAFYRERNYAPLWIDYSALNERAQAAIKYLAGVVADGLNPADYATPKIEVGAAPDALANAEIKLSDALIGFARHARTGRVHFTRVSADIEYALERPEAADVLAAIAQAEDIAAALDSFQPQHAGYKALKAALAEARKAPEEKPDVVRIAGGPILRPGMRDARVPDVRTRLGIAEDADHLVYDDTVFAAVTEFQRDNGLGPDGMLGPATLRAMNGGQRRAADRTAIIIANMDRWRWLPRDLGRTHVMVNIPDFTLRVMRDNKLVWKTKIVVGKPSLVTPMISAQMKFITVNPTWNVPPSIIRNEYLPALQEDPMALERIGLKLEQNADGTIRIYQPPGDRNALGRIRFNFPNKFLVYQHDTPDKHLFARDTRAYSHGCMRVQDPLKYGEVLLSLAMPGEDYTQERLRRMFGGSEININFPRPIPVHLTYQTAFVDDAGTLQIRGDIYGRDARMLAVLNNERRVADIPMERPRVNSAEPVRMPIGAFGGYGGYYRGGPSFFERLFGVAPEPYVEPPPRTQRRRSYTDGWRRFN